MNDDTRNSPEEEQVEGGIARRVKRRKQSGETKAKVVAEAQKEDSDEGGDEDDSTLFHSIGQARGAAAATGVEGGTSSLHSPGQNLERDDDDEHHEQPPEATIEEVDKIRRKMNSSPYPLIGDQSQAPTQLGAQDPTGTRAYELRAGAILPEGTGAISQGAISESAAIARPCQHEMERLKKFISEQQLKAATSGHPVLAPKGAEAALGSGQSAQHSISSQQSSQSDKSGKGKKRGPYQCTKCGKLTKNHICEAILKSKEAQTEVCTEGESQKISVNSGNSILTASAARFTSVRDGDSAATCNSGDEGEGREYVLSVPEPDVGGVNTPEDVDKGDENDEKEKSSKKGEE